MVLAAFILNLLGTIGMGISVIVSILRLLITIGVFSSGSIDFNGEIIINNNMYDPNSFPFNALVLTFLIIGIVISVIYFVGNLLFTIFSYKVYKGKMKNSLAISILDLIFGNVISGILLIIDYSDKKDKGVIE